MPVTRGADDVQDPDPRNVAPCCSIPRAMMLEIMREQEMNELLEEREHWELRATHCDERARLNLQAVNDRIGELARDQPRFA